MFLKRVLEIMLEYHRQFLRLPETSEEVCDTTKPVELLKTIQIDTQKGICLINGTNVSKQGKYLKLEFENGEWSLLVTTDRCFSSAKNKITTEGTSL